MTFDFATQRVVLTTGLQHFTYQWEDDPADATVYEWDSAAGTFVVRAPLGIPPKDRGGAVAVGDPNRHVVYLVSGLQENENPSSPSGWDTKLYVWDGVAGTWTVRDPADAPSAREFASGFFDTATDRFVLTGGVWYGWLNTPEYNQYDPVSNTWSSSGADASYNRFWSPLAFDEANGVAIQFSGEIGDTVYYGSGPSNAPADTREFAGGVVTTLAP